MTNFEKRIRCWCEVNGFIFVKEQANQILLERKSDNYPFQVDKRLIDQILKDEGF